MKKPTGSVWHDQNGKKLKCELCGKARRKGTAWCSSCLAKAHENLK